MRLVLTLALALTHSASAEAQGVLEEEGHYVRFYGDGTASVSRSPDLGAYGWSIDCRADAMTDERPCSVFSDPDGVVIHYRTSVAPILVCATGHDDPNRTAMLRVDKLSAIHTDTSGCVDATLILPELLAGAVVIARRYQWPSERPVDSTLSLVGLAKAFEVVDRIRNGEGLVDMSPVDAGAEVNSLIAMARGIQPLCTGLGPESLRPPECTSWDLIEQELKALGWCWIDDGFTGTDHPDWRTCTEPPSSESGN